MCIRDRYQRRVHGKNNFVKFNQGSICNKKDQKKFQKSMKFLILLLIVYTFTALNCQPYGYLLLVQEIAGTVCLKKSCTSEYSLNLPQTGVNMHGLWPNYNNGSWPQFCGSLASDAYSDSKIESSLLTQLNQEWVGLYSSEIEFRNHEWQRHGSCFILDMPSQDKTFLSTPNSIDQPMNKFFSTVMQIKQKIGLANLLFNSQQSSDSSGVQWQYSDLQNAFQSAWGAGSFTFNCDSNNNLYTIEICLDPTSYEPINCPSKENYSNTCKSYKAVNVPYFSPE
eukprot:TRINITY_DN3101_c0_g1_i1.p1 TRINITY_DN3101_c0_g1~~TRINITY_DN3101_c0_g1_i1.p1  ORF type:complete len:281 (-),score=28.75 TRINITY_DN3101_c0_g1_i1:109-951(-)